MDIQIFGLATPADYHSYHPDCPYSQAILKGEYELAQGLPEVDQINQVTAALHCREYRVITHVPRPKVVLWGELNLKLTYSSLATVKKVHGDLWGSKFEMLVEIPDYCRNRQVEQVRLLLEDLKFWRIHGRKLTFSYLCFSYLEMGE